MAIARTPVFKRCRHLDLDPIVLGYTHRKSIRNPKRSRRKSSEYAIQLKEKQKVRFVYGVLEKQFRRTYEKAERMEGMTGDNLLRLLEQRLDNVVYRIGYATTRMEARQMVNHGHVLVNGKRVDIPSYQVRISDVISIRDAVRQASVSRKFATARRVPLWLAYDEEQASASVVANPQRSDIDFNVSERAIVELYSK